MGNCRSKIWAQHFSGGGGGGKSKLSDDADNDGLGRGLLAGDESENYDDGGVPTPKKAFDYYGGNFLDGDDDNDNDKDAAPAAKSSSKKKKSSPAW